MEDATEVQRPQVQLAQHDAKHDAAHIPSSLYAFLPSISSFLLSNFFLFTALSASSQSFILFLSLLHGQRCPGNNDVEDIRTRGLFLVHVGKGC